MDKNLEQFIEWLPQNVEELKDKSASEIQNILNELSQTDDGKQAIAAWMKQFKDETQMFRSGGKLAFLVNKFQQGGSIVKNTFIDFANSTLKNNNLVHSQSGTNNQLNNNIIPVSQNKSKEQFNLISSILNDADNIKESIMAKDGGKIISSRKRYPFWEVPRIRKWGDEQSTHWTDDVITYTEQWPFGIKQVMKKPNGDIIRREIIRGDYDNDYDTLYRVSPKDKQDFVISRKAYNFLRNDDLDQKSEQPSVDQWPELLKKFERSFKRYFPKKDEYLNN